MANGHRALTHDHPRTHAVGRGEVPDYLVDYDPVLTQFNLGVCTKRRAAAAVFRIGKDALFF